MKKNILISVIGKPKFGEYKPTKYELKKGVIEETTFFFLPLIKLYKIDKLYLFGTINSIWKKLPPIDIEHEKIIIPHGKSESDQWEIFNNINELSIDNSNVYFDITHGFRTMPFISLLSIFYFKAIMPKIRIEKVLYGNFEGKDANTKVCPVIDLSGFLHIFDWLFAAKSFTKYGNGEELKDLLEKHSEDNDIFKLKEAVNTINSAMQLGYLSALQIQFEEMEKAYNQINVDNIPQISPIKTIMPELSKLTSLIDNSHKEYEKQLTIAKYYYDNNQVVKAVLILRETYVTFIGETGGFPYTDIPDRNNLTEKILNDFRLLKRFKLNKLINLWKKVRKVRNNVGHPMLDPSLKEDIRDKNRIGNWLGESNKLFKDLLGSSKLRKMLNYVKEQKTLKQIKIYSVDDLAEKFNTK